MGDLEKNKVQHTPQRESIAHRPLLGFEPVGGKPLKSVMHGQCDTRPAVTSPAAGTSCLGDKRDIYVYKTCPGLLGSRDLNP